MVNVPTQTQRPFTRREYDRIVALGMLDGESVELIRGFLIKMSPIGTRHAVTVDKLNRLLVRALGERAWVRVQGPYAVDDHSEPEPDLAVLPAEDFTAEHPTTAHLLIEVAESSLDYDRTDKAALYAEADVAEYWIVNLVDDVVEVHRDRDLRGSWRTKIIIPRGGAITALRFPDLTVAVDDILPQR